MENTNNNTPATPAQAADLERRLAEAEERGYRRGINEQIESRMKEPALWEGLDDSRRDEPPREFQILGSMRRSIWD